MTDVITTCFRPSRWAASATRSGSSASSASVLPLGTEQKPQGRVQTLPRIMNVAVFCDQHSMRFGHLALSQPFPAELLDQPGREMVAVAQRQRSASASAATALPAAERTVGRRQRDDRQTGRWFGHGSVDAGGHGQRTFGSRFGYSATRGRSKPTAWLPRRQACIYDSGFGPKAGRRPSHSCFPSRFGPPRLA